mmetsp:Transcript_87743/g.171604  ORF Transcript_87743/g.171604 Transcript_87743/m.171604 type:complete len:203 (-) Transcript_87743:244-852(-)
MRFRLSQGRDQSVQERACGDQWHGTLHGSGNGQRPALWSESGHMVLGSDLVLDAVRPFPLHAGGLDQRRDEVHDQSRESGAFFHPESSRPDRWRIPRHRVFRCDESGIQALEPKCSRSTHRRRGIAAGVFPKATAQLGPSTIAPANAGICGALWRFRADRPREGAGGAVRDGRQHRRRASAAWPSQCMGSTNIRRIDIFMRG